MKYFKNQELMRLFNVSDKTVRNWIEAAQSGKLSLELYKDGDKTFIGDTLNNNIILERQSARGKKYRNQRSLRRLKPMKELYDLYTQDQIIDIISNLETYRELPLQYRYCGGGAQFWDAYLQKLYTAGKKNTLTNTIELLELNKDYLFSLLKDYDYINVVDIGVGNGLATKSFLRHIKASGKLNKYIGIDISQELLDVTEQNIKTWFDNSIHVENYRRDITSERLQDILAVNTYSSRSKVANILLFLGGTILNLREPEQVIKNIRGSMSPQDLLITSLKLDSAAARKFFDFNVGYEGATLTLHGDHTLPLLNINPPLYEVEQFFSEQEMSRLVQIRLKSNVLLDFNADNLKCIVELEKGERILLCRIRHYSSNTLASLFEKNGFSNLQFIKSADEEWLLLVSKIRLQKHSPPIIDPR